MVGYLLVVGVKNAKTVKAEEADECVLATT